MVDPERKQACAHDLGLYCKSYYPKVFHLPFSNDHHQVIRQLETATLDGGLFALAMPRGSGKTTLVQAAALWAVSYGYHPFVLVVGSTGDAAKEILESIKTEIRVNDLLLADFPEICFPVRALEGITNRAAGQRFAGRPTFITWTKTTIVLPTIAGSAASGAIVRVAGLNGRIRGMNFKTPEGRTVRPTLVIPDDPQTDQSARNPAQCKKREDLITGAILGTAGPGEKITVAMPCTVIEQDDLADRMLDRKSHPEWHGIRTKTLYRFPDALDTLWVQYAECQRTDPAAATRFYAANRVAMDAGAQVGWPERFEPDELSGLQRAMNLFFANRASFAAEYQNTPTARNAAAVVKILSASQIAEKLNRVPRGTVPLECSRLNCMIDVQQTVLFWMVCAWSQEFDGAIVDYGTWPEQNRPYFSLADLRVTIADALPEITGLEAQIHTALEQCTRELLAREFPSQDGAPMRLGRVVIDANWLTKTVKKFCRTSPHAGIMLPSHGRGIGAKKRPISQWKNAEGTRRGEEWIVGRAAEVKGVRHITFDANYWKSRVHAQLRTHPAEPGSLALFGDSPAVQRMLADHLTAEKPTRVEAAGRTVDEWELKPERPDNHWFDSLVGCAVGASYDGCELKHKVAPEKPKPQERPRRRARYLT